MYLRRFSVLLNILILLSLFFVSDFKSQYSTAANNPAAMYDGVECPKKQEDWPQFLKAQIARADKPFRLIMLEEKLRTKCEATKTDPFVAKCMQGLKGMAKAFGNPFHLGVEKKAPSPKSLVLPSAFVDPEFVKMWSDPTVSREEVNAKVAEFAKKLPPGSKTIEFVSKSQPGVRIFMTKIPGEEADIDVHHHTGKKDHPESDYLVIRTVKMVNGKKLDQPEMEFFIADPKKRGVTSPPTTAGRCVSCHRGTAAPVLPFSDSAVSHDPDMTAEQLVKWFNENRVTDANVSNLDFDHLGPPMGPDRAPWRTDEFIGRCSDEAYPELTATERSQVRNAMNCVGCHKEEGLGTKNLRYPIHTEDFGFNFFDHIIASGYMPAKAKIPLNFQTRQALLRCLKFEYFGGFGDRDFNQGNSEPGILMRSLVPPECSAEGKVATPRPATENKQ